MVEELDQALTKSTKVLTNKCSEFAATYLDELTDVAHRISELKELAQKSVTSAVASGALVSTQPDTRQWPARDNRGQVSSAALIITDAASRSQMSMTVAIDYTKMSMTELQLCQLAIMKEIQARDHYSQMQLENTTKQSESLAAQLEEVEQKKKEAESKQATLAQVLDEVCQSLPDFDMQAKEELE